MGGGGGGGRGGGGEEEYEGRMRLWREGERGWGWGWGLKGGERGRKSRLKPKPYQVTPQKTNPSQKPIFQLRISYSPLNYQNFL